MSQSVRYAVGELARLAGVSRRTVRYYVQEGLISPPLGVGRGDHYTREHLDQILQVKAMQEAGRSLDEIRAARSGRTRHRATPAATEAPPLDRSLWRRLVLAPGVELHLSSQTRLPSATRLHELAAWCREHFATIDDDEEGNNA